MTPRTYLEPETNYSITPLPATIAKRAADFESSRPDAKILTVYHVDQNRWQFAYATDRGTKCHAEYRVTVTV